MRAPWPHPVRIENIRARELVAEFDDYVPAAEYRRDVLRPQLHPRAQCPYQIVIDCPELRAEEERFEQFCRETAEQIAALPKRMVQGELFDVPALLGIVAESRAGAS